MRKLAQVDGIQAFITIYTNVVTAQMPLADALHVPALSTVESPGLVSKSQYSFAHSPTITVQMPIVKKYWQAAGYKRVAVALGNNALGLTIAPYIKSAASDLGMDYSEVFFDLTATDYRGLIAKIKDFNPDVMLVAAQGSVAETTMIRQIRELGLTMPLFLPTNNFQEANWRNALGTAVEGLYLVGPNVTEETSGPFVRAFRAKNNQDPTYISAQVYDLVSIYANAIGQAGYNGPAIRDAIANLRGVKSVMGGMIVMGADHFSVNGAIKIWRVTGGKLVDAQLPTKRR
jgi:ABC-type branched-subunit amino acid transport system substrate-binding protein